MLAYPKMPNSTNAPFGAHCVAFNKLDGSNLRWLWTDKKGWCRQGTRVRLFDQSDDMFGPAIEQFMNELADPLEQRIRDLRQKNFTVFTEWWGVKSFAGNHEADDPKFINVIEVADQKERMLDVYSYLEAFGDWAPRIVYQGEITEEFIQDVRANKFQTEEGVVVKGLVKKKPFMFKVKTDEYKKKLIGIYGQRWMEFWE